MSDLERLSEQRDEGTERRALYALLHEADKAFPIAVNLLRHDGDDFRGKGHAEIFKAALDLWDTHRLNGQFDTAVFLAELRGRGELRRLQHILPQVLTAPEGATNWGTWERMADYCRIITRDAAIRRLALGLMTGTEYLKNGQLDEAVRAARECLDEDGQQSGADAAEPELTFRTLADVAQDVDSRPPRPWLFEPVVVAGDYGVMSAEDKAGKTWAILDAAVSCAAGLPWLTQFPAGHPGPVLVFLGEGSDAKMLRRIRAIAASKGLSQQEADALPIVLCFRAPQLSSAVHRQLIRDAIGRLHPALVIIDPLYLAAGGANGADLYSMGALLGSIQHIVQEAGASLLIAHHWNKTGEGRGHSRSSGVGPGAWGRFLISVAVEQAHTDRDTQETTVRLKWSFKGDEIPETDVYIVRRVRAEDPAKLTSPLHYSIEIADGPSGDDQADEDPALSGLRPAAKRVLAILRSAGSPLNTKLIGDELARDGAGKPLKARTIQDALASLAVRGLAEETEEAYGASSWIPSAPKAAGNDS